jgi:hypothetical protein
MMRVRAAVDRSASGAAAHLQEGGRETRAVRMLPTVRRPKPDIRIELPGAFVLKQRRFERMIRLLRPILELDAPAVIEVDLSRLVSVGPAALALLITALRRVDDAELFADGSILLPPNSPPVAYYLMRMNLVRSLVDCLANS